MYIWGLSAFHHDSATCLLKDEDILVAVQEGRFTRKNGLKENYEGRYELD